MTRTVKLSAGRWGCWQAAQRRSASRQTDASGGAWNRNTCDACTSRVRWEGTCELLKTNRKSSHCFWENNWRCFLRWRLCALNAPHVRFKGLMYGSCSVDFYGNVSLMSTLTQPSGVITHSCRDRTGSKSSNKWPSPSLIAWTSKNELVKINCGSAGSYLLILTGQGWFLLAGGVFCLLSIL